MAKIAVNERLFDDLANLYEDYAYQFFAFKITRKQKEIAREVIKRLMLRKRWRIVISICRQVGKTENVCTLLTIIWKFFEFIHNEKCRMCITAPERGTGSEVYDRVMLMLGKCELYDPHGYQFLQKNNDNVLWSSGTRIDRFGLFKGYAKKEDKKTTREGRTFHLVVRDEMHLGEDEIYIDEIEPAMTTTGGVDVFIGNGGFKTCLAKELCEQGEKDAITVLEDQHATVIKFTYDVMREEALYEYERTGNEMFVRWVESQDGYIAENGRESIFVRKNLFCEWIVEVGNFTTPTQLFKHRRFKEPVVWFENVCDAGLDFGKSDDETVLTFTDTRCNVREWAVFYGEYPEQVEQIAEYILDFERRTGCRVRNIICDSTGAGDPVKSMLRKKTRKNIIGVVFNAKSKDTLAKRAIVALNSKEPDKSLSYPMHHKHRQKFERQMTKLEREIRGDSELINYHHPKKGNIKDDFPDSLFLSLYVILRPHQARGFTQNTVG